MFEYFVLLSVFIWIAYQLFVRWPTKQTPNLIDRRIVEFQITERIQFLKKNPREGRNVFDGDDVIVSKGVVRVGNMYNFKVVFVADQQLRNCFCLNDDNGIFVILHQPPKEQIQQNVHKVHLSCLKDLVSTWSSDEQDATCIFCREPL